MGRFRVSTVNRERGIGAELRAGGVLAEFLVIAGAYPLQ